MKTNIFSYIMPRMHDILFIILFFSVLTNGSMILNSDGDLPRHLLMGRYILQGNPPPTTEIFAYPYMGQEYVPHEWGTGVIFYLLFQRFDLNGIMLLAGLLIGSTFLLVFFKAIKSSTSSLLAFMLVLLGAVVTSVHWLTRPHVFSMLFIAIWLTMLDDLYLDEHKKLWIFPLVMILWANIHAEYISGFLVLGAYLMDSIWVFWRRRTSESYSKFKLILVILLVSFVCSLINPSGIRAWTTVAGYINNSYLMSRIDETKPPNFAELRFMPLLILYGLSIAIMIVRRRNFRPTDFLLMIGFGLMNAVSARNAHLFGVIAPIVLARGLRNIQVSQAFKNVSQMIAKLESFGTDTAIPILSAILLGILLLAGPLKSNNRFDPIHFPVRAVQWLEKNPQHGHMFNHFDWGGYILFHLWPSQKVFIESQTDTHGNLTKDYEIVSDLDIGWENIFKTYDIQWVITPPNWKLINELKKLNWRILYQDDTAIILHRP